MEQAVEAVFENGIFKVGDPSALNLFNGQTVKLLIEETPRLSKEEIARRGSDIYERQVRTVVEADNQGRIVAIDVMSGEFELADSVLTAAARLRARLPEAEVFVLRIGHPALHKTKLRPISKSK